MAIMAPQQQVQQLEQCIQDCQTMIKQMQNLAQSANSIELQSTIKESVHHLEMCIQECRYASQATT